MLQRKIAWLLCAYVLLMAPAIAQTNSLATDAQVAIKKGLLAAQQQDYLLAIRFFQDARKTAPDAPEVFGYLGLAESKIPGRELRAIVWFGAYLAARPRAANAAAVKDQIDMLNVKSQSNLSHLIATAKNAAELVSDNYPKSQYKEEIAIVQLKAGDVVGAKQTIAEAQIDFHRIPPNAWVDMKRLLEMNIGGDKYRIDHGLTDDRNAKISVSVSDWIEKLGALDAPVFLNLTGYLKTVVSDDPDGTCGALLTTIQTIVSAQSTIVQMLKQQAEEQAKL